MSGFVKSILALGKYNLHTHTCFCDGADEPEAMVLEALEKGFSVLGFSGHGPVPRCPESGMPGEREAEYISCIRALQEKYKERIKILCGTEWDYFSVGALDEYDYVIGSVHLLEKCGEIVPVDDGEEKIASAVRRLWHGDWYAMCRDYYALVAQLPERTGADIIGHFDLVTKYNEGCRHFDESDARYLVPAKEAALKLIKSGVLFEVNTGAMARGIKNEPYPAMHLYDFIKKNGGEFILSSDCHDKRYLDFGFENFANLCI